MIRRTFHFCLVPPQKLTASQSKKWEREKAVLLKPLAVPLNRLGDYLVELTPENLRALLAFLEQVRKEKGRLNTLAVSEELVDDGDTPVEWFLLDPQDDGGEVLPALSLGQPAGAEDDYPEMKADRMRAGVHVAGWLPLVFVSERFKTLVEEHHLTGLDFLWCRDTGKYRAPQWYLPIAREPLGRGLDHPAFDASQLSGRGFQTRNPLGRHGQSGMFAEQVKPAVAYADPRLSQLVQAATALELLKRPPPFRSFPVFLRKHLPAADFAYVIQDIDGGDGSVVRQRGLALNRKVRDLLLAKHIVRAVECVCVRVVERPPRGVEDLDARFGPAPPAFEAGELARLREREAVVLARHLAQPKPPRRPDLKRALAMLRARKRRHPECFAAPVKPKALADAVRALKLEIPAAWQQCSASPMAVRSQAARSPTTRPAGSSRPESWWSRARTVRRPWRPWVVSCPASTCPSWKRRSATPSAWMWRRRRPGAIARSG